MKRDACSYYDVTNAWSDGRRRIQQISAIKRIKVCTFIKHVVDIVKLVTK